MLKRENDFEQDDKIEEMKEKYNIEELFQDIVLNQEKENEK